MKRFFSMLLGIVMITSNVKAYELSGAIPETAGDERVTFIVEVEGDPAFVRQNAEKLGDLTEVTDEILQEQRQVMSSIEREISAEPEKTFVYTALFNGFSFEGSKEQEELLRGIDGVKNVYISEKIPVSKPLLHNSGEITGINAAYDIGYSGEGKAIAIIDSFCDTGHEFFTEAPQNPKYTKNDIDNILKKNHLNSGTISANQVYKNPKIPYAFNYATVSSDTYSHTKYHGTHVAGIAAGKDGTLPNGEKFSGIAYDSQIFFMSASDGEYLYDYMIFAAINDAALLGADVINMSFGSDYTDSALGEAYAEIIGNAAKSGISIAAAAGNSARGYEAAVPLTTDTDYSTDGTPASISSVTAVASADNVKINTYRCVVQSGDGGTALLYPAYDLSDFEKLLNAGAQEYEYCGYGRTEDIAGMDLSGKIALVDRGEITFVNKSDNVKAAGAVGIIIINSDDTIIGTVDLSLPAAVVTKSDGDILVQSAEKNIELIKCEAVDGELANAGKMSSFSSWGVDSSLELKPEITAPGGSIYSSYPDNKYTYLSGTSMASPYIAGVLAVARQFYDENPYISEYNGRTGEELVALLENVMMNSADIIRSENGLPYSPRIQGAGMVNVKNMLESKLLITGNSGKAKVSLGEVTDEFDVSFEITNISNETVELDNISIELITDGYIEQNGANYVSDSVEVVTDEINLPETISINSGETYDFSASIKLNDEFLKNNMQIFTNGFFVDGFAVLNSSAGGYTASVPFTGYYGDWYSSRIFDTTVYDEVGCELANPESPYNSGTYLRADIDNSGYYYVGRNAVDRRIADKKYISFSTKSGLTLDFTAKTYRTLSDEMFSIIDENGEVQYYDEINGLFNKFMPWSYKFNNKKMASLPEGSYTLRAEAIVNGNNKITDSVELPLVIDNTAPKLEGAVYDAQSKTITLTASDNHYLSYFYLYSGSENKSSYTAVTEQDSVDGKTVKTIDVSGFANPENITVVACDYAMNSSSKTMKALTDDIGVELKNIICLEDITSAKIALYNNMAEEKTADVMVAFYDENSELIAVSSKKKQILKLDESNVLTYSISADVSNSSKIKVFIWEQDMQTPIDTAKEFDI